MRLSHLSVNYCLTAPFRELFYHGLALTRRAGFFVSHYLAFNQWAVSSLGDEDTSKQQTSLLCLLETQSVSSLLCPLTLGHYTFCIVLGRTVHNPLPLKTHKPHNIQFLFIGTPINMRNCITSIFFVLI